MNEKSVSVHVGPDFAALLAVLFIGLKLTHVIAWSWLWVLAPLWIGFAFALVVFAIILVALLLRGD